MNVRIVAQNLALNLVLALLLFVPAGTLAWPQGWAFLLLVDACSVATGVWLKRTDPALLAERMKSPLGEGQTLRDRLVMTALSACFIVWLVFMPLDARRFHWSHTPVWAQAVGAVLILVAFWAWSRVLRANSYASTRVRLQAERGQTVASTGPYAIVRHPMYADAYLLLIGAPLLLGSLWGLLGALPVTLLLVLRIHGEEAVLLDGLPGYRAYAARVRYRLVPWVW